MWCDDDKIKPYFIEAGKNLTYRNLRRQLTDSLEDKPFPQLPEELQKHTFWEFGSKEEHFKYRNAVMQTYIHGNFPIFAGSKQRTEPCADGDCCYRYLFGIQA